MFCYLTTEVRHNSEIIFVHVFQGIYKIFKNRKNYIWDDEGCFLTEDVVSKCLNGTNTTIINKEGKIIIKNF